MELDEHHIPVPTLQDIALVRVICDLYIESRFNEYSPKYAGLVKMLNLPKCLKYRLLHSAFLKVIGTQIDQILALDERWQFYDPVVDVTDICWTVTGAIDERETVRNILSKQEDDTADYRNCYFVACENCLENEIARFWFSHTMLERSEEYFTKWLYQNHRMYLRAYWTSFITGKLEKLPKKVDPEAYAVFYNFDYSIHQNIFFIALEAGHFVAAKYFWSKLTEEEKRVSVLDVSPRLIENVQIPEYDREKFRDISSHLMENPLENFITVSDHADFLMYLLNYEMLLNERHLIFQGYALDILKILFCCWPCQKYLLPIMKLMGDHLTFDVYCQFLEYIEKITQEDECIERDVSALLVAMPSSLQSKMVNIMSGDESDDEDANHYYFAVCALLLKGKDFNFFNMLLANVSTEDKMKVFSNCVEEWLAYDTIKSIVSTNKLFLLEKVLQANLMPVEVRRFKRDFMKMFGTRIVHRIGDKRYYDDLIEAFSSWYFKGKKAKIHRFRRKVVCDTFYNLLAGNRFDLRPIQKWNYLTKYFLKWFPCEEERKKFNMNLIAYINKKHYIRYLIQSEFREFEFVDVILNTFLTTEQQIREFKERFLLSNDGALLCKTFSEDIKFIESFGRWLYPVSQQVLGIFRRRIEGPSVSSAAVLENFARQTNRDSTASASSQNISCGSVVERFFEQNCEYERMSICSDDEDE